MRGAASAHAAGPVGYQCARALQRLNFVFHRALSSGGNSARMAHLHPRGRGSPSEKRHKRLRENSLPLQLRRLLFHRAAQFADDHHCVGTGIGLIKRQQLRKARTWNRVSPTPVRVDTPYPAATTMEVTSLVKDPLRVMIPMRPFL